MWHFVLRSLYKDIMVKKKLYRCLVFCVLFLSLPINTYAQTATVYTSNLTGPNQVPPNTSPATGTATLTITGTTGTINLSFSKLLGTEVNAHIHGPAAAGDVNAIIFIIPLGSPINNFTVNLTQQQLQWLQSGLLYMDVHSNIYPDGEIRDQLRAGTGTTPTTTPTIIPNATFTPTTSVNATDTPTPGTTNTPIPTIPL